MINTDKYEGHTPGPWEFDGIECVSGCGSHPTEEPVFATLHVHEEFLLTEENMLANGKLIAAAPLLLDMLNELLEECRMHYWCYESENDDDVCARCGGNNEHKEWCDL